MANATPTKNATHPARGCTKAQFDVFEAIASGQSGPFHPATVRALMDKNLIEQGDDEVIGRDRFGVISRPSYYVPIHLHAQWCQWCSENLSDSDREMLGDDADYFEPGRIGNK